MILRFETREEFLELIRISLGKYVSSDDYVDEHILELNRNGLIELKGSLWKLTPHGSLVIGELLNMIDTKFINQDINIVTYRQGKI